MSKNVNKVINALNDFTENLMTKAAVNITKELSLANPVDTGFSRARWHLNAGSPTIDNRTERSISNVPGEEAIKQATLAGIKFGYRLNQGAIYITNHTPYIGDLNDGSSPQAPAGFVERSIAMGIQQTKSEFFN